MPNLIQCLQIQDIGYLRIVAELWGIELPIGEASLVAEHLASAMCDPVLLEEVIGNLPSDALSALQALQQSGGKMPWSNFTRRFGKLREMGAGRRDRERPYSNPISPVEVLWYRGLIGRGFFDTDSGAEEFAYLPQDLLPLLPLPHTQPQTILGRHATPKERTHIHLANDLILDHACTLLAALRIGLPLDPSPYPLNSLPYPLVPTALKALLFAGALIDDQGTPLAEPTRAFLESSRAEALALLSRAWLNSTTFNELRLMPGLHCEGEWENNPLATRQTIVRFLLDIPRGSWWHLDAFVADIRKHHPDFQRPAGDYDSWFIRDESTGEYLRGFEHWDKVDGALVRYVITAPMHWLGMVDLASPTDVSPVVAFRLSRWAEALLQGDAPQGLATEDETFLISRDGRIRVPRYTPRAARYLLARFSEWEGENEQGYRYRLTAASLERAQQQGLRVDHLVTLLRRHALGVPPSLVQAVQRWERYGSEASLENLLILRVKSPHMLQKLRASRANRFLVESLSPQAVIVKPGAADKVLSVLAELGYLGKIGESN